MTPEQLAWHKAGEECDVARKNWVETLTLSGADYLECGLWKEYQNKRALEYDAYQAMIAANTKG